MNTSQPMALLTMGAYEPVSKAEQYAEQFGYVVDPEFTDRSEKRTHTTYVNPSTGEAVLAFRGTSKRGKGEDILTDIQTSLNIYGKPFKEAERIAKTVQSRYPELTMAGHSIGATKALWVAPRIGASSVVAYSPYVKSGLAEKITNVPKRIYTHVSDPIGTTALQHLKPEEIFVSRHKTTTPHAISEFVFNPTAPITQAETRKEKLKTAGKVLGASIATGLAVGSAVALSAKDKRKK